MVRESDARSWGEQQECNPYTIGHQCTGGDPYAEDGSDTAAMNYQGGYDSGFAAGMTWGTAMASKTEN